MEDEHGVVDHTGTTDGAIQCTDDRLGQDSGGADREHEMEHGITYDAKTKKGIRDLNRVLQRSVEANADDFRGRKELDADDQATMDELCRTCDAREQRPNDDSGDIMAKYGRKKKTERGRETSSKRQGEDKVVGFGIRKVKGGALGIRDDIKRRGEQQTHVEGARGDIRDTGAETTTGPTPGHTDVCNMKASLLGLKCRSSSKDTGHDISINLKENTEITRT